MLGVIFSKVIQPFMPYLLGASMAGIAILSGLLWLSGNKYDKLLQESASKIERVQANNLALQSTLTTNKKAILLLQEQYKSNEALQQSRLLKLRILRKEFNDEMQKFSSYKTRWAKVANRKPKLLSNIINRATAKRVQFFSTATCRADCGKGKAYSAGSDTPSEARSD